MTVGREGGERAVYLTAWLVAALLGACGVLQAQRYPVRNYTEIDGLPNSHVVAIGQDRGGVMWFVTRTTVVTYDGDTWKEVRTAGGKVLRNFKHLLFDRDGDPWLVRPYGAFSRRAAGTWTEHPGSTDGRTERVRTAALLHAGGETGLALTLWSGGLEVWEGRDWTRYTASDGLPSTTVLSLAEDGDSLLVGTADGLARYRDGVVTTVAHDEIPLPPGAVLSMASETGTDGGSGGRLWIQGETWLGSLEDGVFRLVLERDSVPANDPMAPVRLLSDRAGGLYRGGKAAIQLVDTTTLAVQRLGRNTGLAGDGLRALLRDREGNIWIATERGASKMGNRGFTLLDSRSGLLADEVTAIIRRRSGELVLGHNTGLTLHDGQAYRPLRLAPAGSTSPALTRVLDIAEEPGGALWVAASSLGVARVAPDGTIGWYRSEGLSANTVEIDEEGRVLVGDGRGLSRPGAGTLVRVREPGGPRVAVRRLQLGAGGRLFVSTQRDGLYVRQAGRWFRPRFEQGEAWNSIYAAHTDRRKRTWVGTGAGLLLMDGERLMRPDAPALRFERPVYFVIEDARGRLWFGTDRGVVVWDGASTRRYNRRTGLAGNEMNRAAALADPDGRLWLGTDTGLSRFDPRHERPPVPPPLLELVELQTRSGPANPRSGEFELGATDNDVTLVVRTVSFLDEDAVRLQARLAGYDHAWTHRRGAGLHELRYTNLPAGTYHLEAQAQNAEGTWSAALVSGDLVVARAFWTTWWFYGLCLLGVAGGTLGVQRFMAHLSAARLLEARVRQRTAQLRQSERAMAAERQRLATVLASVGDGVIAVDRQGRVTLINAAAERLTGRQAAKVLGLPLGEILALSRPGDDGTRIDVAGLLSGAAHPAEDHEPLVFSNRAGETRLLELRVAPLADPAGESPGHVIAVQDVTERRRTEEQLARSARLSSLGLLARGIAHDFNNVLTAVSGHLSLAARQPAAGDHLASAERAVDRATALSRQLLTFARGGAPVRKPLPLEPVLRDAAQLAFSGSDVSCAIDVPHDLWPLAADESQMHQVFQNLLINARQALPGGGTVTVRARNLPPGGERTTHHVRISVHDPGQGIPAERLGLVFDPFYTTKETGTGLGLATTHSIVTRHGGSIDVESPAGNGTTFTLVLPASERRTDGAGETPVVEGPRGNGRVLVMDDEAPVREALSDMLRALGLDVVATAEGGDALRAYAAARDEARPFDVVILDLTVPGGMGGLDTLRQLRRIDPQVRAVASSGYSEDAAMARGAAHGFVATLPKPYRMQDVAEVVERVAPRRAGADLTGDPASD